MKFIATANYRDRSAKNKWLFRKVGETREEGKEARTLLLTGVEIRDAHQYAEGSGCSSVALAEDAKIVKGGDYAAYSQRVKFQSSYFYLVDDKEEYLGIFDGAPEFLLWHDGTMWIKPIAA